MTTWINVFNQTNWGSNTTPDSVANSTANVPGWIDKAGVWRVNSTRIQSPVGGSYTNYLYRSETAQRDIRVVAKLETDSQYRNFWLRLNPITGNAYYLQVYPSTQDLVIGASVSSVNTPITTISGSTWGYTPGHNYEIDFSVAEVSPTLINLSIKDLDTNTTVYTLITVNDSTTALQTTGTLGLSYYDATGTSPSYFSHVSYYRGTANNEATTYTLVGSTSTYVGVPNTYLVSLPNGTTSNPVTITFNSNNGGSFSSNTVTLSTSTPSKYVIYTPANTGSITISTTNNLGLTNPSTITLTTDAITSNVLKPGNSNAYLSPYNWTTRYGYWESNNTGAYIKFKFTGTSLTLYQDLTHLIANSVGDSNYPILRWLIDDQTYTTKLITSTDTSVVLANSLTDTTHTCKLWVNALSYNLDRWNEVISSVRFQYFKVDSGKSFSLPDISPNTAIIYGDSITEGIGIYNGTNRVNSASESFAASLASLLNVEVGQIGFAYQGWTATGNAGTNVGSFLDTWDYQLNNVARDFTISPDTVYVCLGRNDLSVSDDAVKTAVLTWLDLIRSTVDSSTEIVLVIPFARTKVDGITAAYSTYKEANPDDKLYLIDLGETGTLGLLPGSSVSIYSNDGVHPNIYDVSRLVPLLFSAINSLHTSTMALPTKQDVIDTLNTFYESSIYSDFNTISLDKLLIALAIINTQSTGGGGSGSSATEYAEGATTSPATGVVSLGRNSSNQLEPIALNASNQPIVSVVNFPTTQPISGSVSVSNFPATQPVSIASLPSLAAGSNSIGSVSVSNHPAFLFDGSGNLKVNFPTTQTVSGSISVSNFPSTQAISAASLPLPSGAATAANQAAPGTAGSPSSAVLSVQGVTNGTVIPTTVTNTISATGTVSVTQTPGEIFNVTLNAGNNLAGKFTVNYATEGASVFLSVTVPANTTAGTWVNMSFWQEFAGATKLFLPIRCTTAANPTTITGDVSIEWSHDQQVTTFYESVEVLGTQSNGETPVTNSTKYWTFALNSTGFKGGIFVTKKARYMRLRMRLSGSSSTAAAINADAQAIYF